MTNDPIPARAPAGVRRQWWIPAVLLSLFAAQSLWFIATQSLTYDEPAHIIAGMEAWQQGRFEIGTTILRWDDCGLPCRSRIPKRNSSGSS